jgi:hypothetical protein
MENGMHLTGKIHDSVIDMIKDISGEQAAKEQELYNENENLKNYMRLEKIKKFCEMQVKLNSNSACAAILGIIREGEHSEP